MSLPVSKEPKSTEPRSVGKLLRLRSATISATASPAKLSTLPSLRPESFSRRLCFDLENRPLAYWYEGATTSQITAFGWKWDGDRTVDTLLLQPGGYYEDAAGNHVEYAEAHAVFANLLEDADLVYGHNIRRHDLPMLQGQLLRLGLPPLGRLTTSDTCRDYPKRKDMSVSLENLAALYGLEGEKKRMAQADWEQANRLEPDGVAAARERVVSDVLLQAELRATLLARGVLGAPKAWKP